MPATLTDVLRDAVVASAASTAYSARLSQGAFCPQRFCQSFEALLTCRRSDRHVLVTHTGQSDCTVTDDVLYSDRCSVLLISLAPGKKWVPFAASVLFGRVA